MLTLPSTFFSFNPRQNPTVIRWYDGSDPLGTGAVPADGTALSTLVDKCKNENLVQATGGNQALCKRNQFNGLASVLLNGSSIFKTATTLTNTQFTVFIVYQALAVSSLSVPLYNGNSGANGWGYACQSASHLRAIFQGGVAFKTDSTMPTSTLEKATITWNGATSIMNINGVSQTIASASSAPNTPSGGNLIIGKDGSAGTAWFNGYLCELIICNTGLSAANIALMENYLKRWGV